MGGIVVPDPEPDWEAAPEYQARSRGVIRNPALQYFTFEQAIADFRPIAGLKPNIKDIARRFHLLLEPGMSDLGPVDAAFFAIRGIGFAIYSLGDDFTLLSLHRTDETNPIAAIDVLLEALGVDWRAVATVARGEDRTLSFHEPTLDGDLRPTFPQAAGETERSSSEI